MGRNIFIIMLFLFSAAAANAQWTKVQDLNNYLSLFSDNGSGRLYVGAYGGVYCSSNSGSNWTFSNPGIQSSIVVIAVASKDSVVLACTSTDMYKSVNFGTSWVNILQGYNGLGQMLVTDNYIFGISSTAVMRSSNNGSNWVYVITGLPGNSNLTCLSGSAGRLYTAGLRSDGVYTSTNNGDNWIKAGTEIPSGIGIYTLYAKNNLVMAGTDNGVYISTNSGSGWRLIPEIYGDFGAYGFTSYNTNNIFIGAWGVGVYASTNYGQNWIFWNQGMTNALCNGMYYYNNYVFCGTVLGIFRRPVTEVGIRNLGGTIPGNFILYQNYPNPFNPTTKIKFAVSENANLSSSNGKVTLEIYDINGRKLLTPINENLHPGLYEYIFDGSLFVSGVYFYRLTAGMFTDTKKLLLIK